MKNGQNGGKENGKPCIKGKSKKGNEERKHRKKEQKQEKEEMRKGTESKTK